MKKFILLKVVFMFFSSTSLALTDVDTKLSQILHRPLIVGASISGDYLTQSPGKLLALRFTETEKINVIAAKGMPGRDIMKQVSKLSLKDRSAVIGVDLFFWDSFAPNTHETLKAVDKIVNLAVEKNIPLVLGEVPLLMPSRQASLPTINDKILEACKKYSQCYMLPLNSIFRKVLADGYILHEGKKHPLEVLMPDGLHIAKPASEYLADQIHKLF